MESSGRFRVDIRIHDETELYISFDPDGHTLSGDLCEYIGDALRERSLGESMQLHIITDKEIDIPRFHAALKQYAQRQTADHRRSKNANRLNALRMFGIGIVFILLGIFLHGHLGSVLTTVIETLGSFSIWEAANVWLQELPKLRFMERVAKHLRDPEVQVEITEQAGMINEG